MPEGDTIHKLASAIAPRLTGTSLARFELRGDPTLDLAGRRVEKVRAQGKHLVIELEGDLWVRTHLGMTGSWHRYATGERWKRPPRQASVVLANGEDVFVCFNAKEAECIRAHGRRAAESLGRLGPDLTSAEEPDVPRLVERARKLVNGDAPVVDALLHQGVASGIGNVYKSEVLFLHGVDPRRTLGSVEDEALGEMFVEAHELLRANLHGGRRVTRTVGDGKGDLWVYRRGGRECFRCTTRIESAVLGRGRRITFWCPRCQR